MQICKQTEAGRFLLIVTPSVRRSRPFPRLLSPPPRVSLILTCSAVSDAIVQSPAAEQESKDEGNAHTGGGIKSLSAQAEEKAEAMVKPSTLSYSVDQEKIDAKTFAEASSKLPASKNKAAAFLKARSMITKKFPVTSSVKKNAKPGDSKVLRSKVIKKKSLTLTDDGVSKEEQDIKESTSEEKMLPGDLSKVKATEEEKQSIRQKGKQSDGYSKDFHERIKSKKQNFGSAIKNKKRKLGGRENFQLSENAENSRKKGEANDTEENRKENGGKKEKLGGLIFMCSSKTRPDCIKYRVMGVNMGKKDLVMTIQPGLKLFLYDYDLKLMYGIFKASSGGGIKLEPRAFNGAFPVQVRFNVQVECYPLPKVIFKKAILDNFTSKHKFRTELSHKQVRKLSKLFQPVENWKENGGKKEKLGGLIFMCSSKTKPDCIKYRVVGVNMGKKDLVMAIQPGLKLFLYDYDLKLMYGIFKASSGGGIKLEPRAFNGAFPVQVRFNVQVECYPLPKVIFKKAILDNFTSKHKFRTELSHKQVRKLSKLFQPVENMKENGGKKEKLGGLIFMCSSKTRPDCIKYRVMGVNMGKKDLVMAIQPGLKLFHYDYDLKLMYGIFKASSGGGIKLEPRAFNGAFPVQVLFNVQVECYPLPEVIFKKAILDNFTSKHKFRTELSHKQVRKLSKLFQPVALGVDPRTQVAKMPDHSSRRKRTREGNSQARERAPHTKKSKRESFDDNEARRLEVHVHGRDQRNLSTSRRVDAPRERDYRDYGLQGERMNLNITANVDPLLPSRKACYEDHLSKRADEVRREPVFEHPAYVLASHGYLDDIDYRTYYRDTRPELSPATAGRSIGSTHHFYPEDQYIRYRHGPASRVPYAECLRREDIPLSSQHGYDRTRAYGYEIDRVQRMEDVPIGSQSIVYIADSLEEYDRAIRYRIPPGDASHSPVSARYSFAGPRI